MKIQFSTSDYEIYVLVSATPSMQKTNELPKYLLYKLLSNKIYNIGK